MKKIEFITRIRVNDTREELPPDKAAEVVKKRIHEALVGMNYEKKGE